MSALWNTFKKPYLGQSIENCFVFQFIWFWLFFSFGHNPQVVDGHNAQFSHNPQFWIWSGSERNYNSVTDRRDAAPRWKICGIWTVAMLAFMQFASTWLQRPPFHNSQLWSCSQFPTLGHNQSQAPHNLIPSLQWIHQRNDVKFSSGTSWIVTNAKSIALPILFQTDSDK